MATHPSPSLSSSGPAVTREAPHVPSAPSTRLSGRRLVRARVAWGAIASLLVGLYILLLPAYWAQLRSICTGIRCALAQPSPASASALQSLGLSVAGYAGLSLVASLLSSLICFVVAGVIVWRKSNDWMALVVALAVVALGTALVPNQLETARTSWQLPALVADVLNFALLFLLAALFPSGHFVPRWTRWLVIGWVAAGAVVISALLVSGELWIDAYEALWVAATAGVLVAQIYRYRAVSDARERAQTRWVVFGGSAALVTAMALTAPTLLVPALGQPGSLFELLSSPVGALAISAFSLSLGMAILRHHLFEIDVLIRRTVIYSLVTGTLATTYAISSIVLQAGFEAVTRQGSPLAVVSSTLLIAALFVPVRSRVQATVDRRFYRRKYDAAKTVAAFGHTMRTEMDLARLTEHLVRVVEETMQPRQVSLWLVQRARQNGPGGGQHVEEAAVDAAARLPKPVPLPGLFAMPEGPQG